jgi:predicted lipoprotein
VETLASFTVLKKYAMQRISIITTLLIAFLFTFSSCSEKDKAGNVPTGSSSDRQLMLTNLADNVIIPAYGSFNVKLTAMITKSDAFRANANTTTLTEFRTAWKEAYIEWQKVALFDFGPATDNALNAFLNVYPANVTTINSNIAAGNASLETFGSYPAQGFPALDYLINGIAETDAEIVEQYTTEADADKRKAYLLQLTNQMQAKFNLVNNAWKDTYRNSFVASAGTGLYSSTALMVNGVVYYYERYLRSGKFGIPSGAMIGGTLLPGSVEAYYNKDIAKTLAQTAHEAYVDFFNGKGFTTGIEGPSLKTYLNALDAKDATTKVLLSETINTQFGVVKDKLALLSGEDLSNEVSNNNNNMKAVYDAMQTAVRMLKVDMTSATSVTITYTDNDGD